MLFSSLIASGEVAEPVNGFYPGGASVLDPVPEQVAWYANEWQYGIFAFLVLALAVFAVTRLNVDR